MKVGKTEEEQKETTTSSLGKKEQEEMIKYVQDTYGISKDIISIQ